jgi:hypothetical protein
VGSYWFEFSLLLLLLLLLPLLVHIRGATPTAGTPPCVSRCTAAPACTPGPLLCPVTHTAVDGGVAAVAMLGFGALLHNGVLARPLSLPFTERSTFSERQLLYDGGGELGLQLAHASRSLDLNRIGARARP